MRMIVVFLLCVASALAIDKVTTPYTAVSKAVISAAGTNQNRDSLRNAVNRTIDTVNTFVPRWVQVLRGDSTFHRINVDSIRSAPNIDSVFATPLYIKGRAVIDTVAGTQSSATIGIFDSLNTRALGGTIGIFDSLKTRALGGTTKTDTINSIKGIKAPVFTGVADSSKGTHHLNGGLVNGTTGTFSSWVKMDSINVRTIRSTENVYGTYKSWACTLSGFTTTVTGNVLYSRSGASVTMLFYSASLYGTSNATTMVSNALPAGITPVLVQELPCIVADNGNGVLGSVMVNSDNKLYFYKDGSKSGFTSSGTKSVGEGNCAATITYITNQ